MKRPKPGPPAGLPEGTVQLGGPIGWFAAALRIGATDLDPERITQLLGRPPDRSQRRGVPAYRADGSSRGVPRHGAWIRELRPAQTDEWDVEEVVRSLFDGLPDDAAVWEQVAAHGRIQVSLGLSLDSDNQEFDLSPETIRFLAERHCGVWFDLYRGDEASADPVRDPDADGTASPA